MAAEGARERRIVSVLFADLVGFTTLAEGLDSEDVASVQDAYFAAVRETVGRYGGRLEKFIGDAAMAVFGVPRARDDDAERAVRAGLALTSAVEQLGARLGLEQRALRLRVGVNSGEVVHDEAADGRVTGDTVNVAARFQTAAPPGGVLVGEATALAVADSVELEAAGPLELKGKAERVKAWQATRLRPEPSRDFAMGRLRAPLTGRDEELSLLRQALARGDGRITRLAVVAPPGVGKTRLVEEFARLAAGGEEPPLVWRARLRPELLSPYEAVGQLILGALADAGCATDVPAARDLVRGRIGRLGLPAARAQVVEERLLDAVWPSGDDDTATIEDREALFDVWLMGLEALAGGRRALWIVEDVHWSGGDLLAFLDAASDRPARAPTLVLATARPALLERVPHWSHAAGGLLHLPTLAERDAGTLVRELVGDALPPGLVDAVVDRSDGNPLFIEELLRTWISVGLLAESNGGWRLTAPGDEVTLPTTVQAIYAAQIDDLPPETRLVVRRAAVAGRRFPIGALEPLGISHHRPAIEVLRTRALIAGPRPDTLFGDTYVYRHALLRDAGYASLARAERAALHVRLARWLEAVAAERPADLAEVVARHYAAALEETPALAAEVGDGLDRTGTRALASTWFERAAGAALAGAAHEAARSLMERALELTPEDDTVARARRLRRLGEILAFSADMQTGAAAVAEAVDLLRAEIERESSPEHREAVMRGYARAAASLGEVQLEQLRFADTRTLVNEALDRVSVEDEGVVRLLIIRGHATVALENDVETASADSARALELARRLEDPALELEAQAWLARMHIPYAKALAAVDWPRVGRFAKELGRWSTVAGAIESQGMYALVDDRPSDVFPHADRLTETARTYGLAEFEAWADYLRTEARLVLGDWDEACASGVRATELAARNAYHRVYVRTWMALLPLVSGRRDRALAEGFATWFHAFKERLPGSPFSRLARANYELHLSRVGLADPPALEPERILPAYDLPWGHPSLFVQRDNVLEEWLERGAVDAARAAIERVGRARGEGVSRLGAAAEQLARARVLAAEGAEGAAAEGETALRAFAELRVPPWQAKAIRLLESIGHADASLRAEADGIERRLGLASS